MPPTQTTITDETAAGTPVDTPNENSYGQMLTNLENTQQFLQERFGSGGNPIDTAGNMALDNLNSAINTLRNWGPQTLGSNPK